MGDASDSNQPNFWTARYAAGKTPWDFGGVPSALKSFLERSSVPGTVLIPGCGSGYEIQAFHAAGYDVSAIDFSPAAVDQAKRVLGSLAERVILGDFFTLRLRPAPLRPPLRTDISLFNDSHPLARVCEQNGGSFIARRQIDRRLLVWTKAIVGAALSDYTVRSRAAFQKTLSPSAE